MELNLEMDDESNESQTSFDVVIGHIEDIVVEDRFQSILHEFMEKYCDEFDDTEENKISYTPIYEEYIGAIETFIVEALTRRMPEFELQKFSDELKNQKSTLDGEIFELLFTLTDFLAFKEMLLDYKNSKNSEFQNLHDEIYVTSLSNSSDLI